MLYDLLVTVPLNFGALSAYRRAARGERVAPVHVFQAFRTAYVSTLVTHVLFVVLVGAGLLALVVPGVIIATPPVVRGVPRRRRGDGPDRGRPREWRRTDGFAGRIFVLWLLGIPIVPGGPLLAGVGVVPGIMWIHPAFATMFVGVTEGYDGVADDVSATRPAPGTP